MYIWILLIFCCELRVGVSSEFCSRFTSCETCAGRHRKTFEQCMWCPAYKACVPLNNTCRSGFRESVDCPTIIPVLYNETFARSIVTPIVAAAQGTYAQIEQCISKASDRIQLLKRFVVQTSQGDRTDAFIAVDFSNQYIITSFSSVAGGRKLLNSKFSREFFTNRQAQFEKTDGLVNRFTYDSWFKLWYVLGMHTTLAKVLQHHEGYKLLCVGHALGGAKAEMTAVAAALNNMTDPANIHLMTLGATRLGDLSFVNLLETMVSSRFRVVHNRDMVVRYPKIFPGEWTPPHHHRFEVWYPNSMSVGSRYYICLGAEDPKCSSRVSPWLLDASHNDVYFGRNIRKWAQTGCENSHKLTEMRRVKSDDPVKLKIESTKKFEEKTISDTSPVPSNTTLETTSVIGSTTMTTTSTLATTLPAPVGTTSAVPTSTVFTLPWWYTTSAWSTLVSTETTMSTLAREQQTSLLPEENNIENEPIETSTVKRDSDSIEQINTLEMGNSIDPAHSIKRGERLNNPGERHEEESTEERQLTASRR